MRLKLGFFSDANVLNYKPQVYPKVRVRLKLGCGLNQGFYGTLYTKDLEEIEQSILLSFDKNIIN